MARKQPKTTNENGGRVYNRKKDPAKPPKASSPLGRKAR